MGSRADGKRPRLAMVTGVGGDSRLQILLLTFIWLGSEVGGAIRRWTLVMKEGAALMVGVASDEAMGLQAADVLL
ncbi:hypothetical protein BHE74_00046643 [Ensete ventricosum]|nr:hypothetical protein BHE74_00046643 [Ensete ventricosum]